MSASDLVRERDRSIGRRSTLRAMGLVVGAAFAASPALAAFAVVFVPLSQLTPQIGAVILKYLADAVVSRDVSAVLWASVAFGVLRGVLWAWVMTGSRMRLTLSERTDMVLERRLVDLVAGIPTVEHHENPEYANRMELVRQSRGQLGQSVNSLLSYLTVGIGLVVTLVLLARLHPLLLALPAFGVPSAFANVAASRRFARAEEALVEPWRRSDHLHQLCVGADTAKEIRVFGLQSHVAGRQSASWEEGYAHFRRAAPGVIALRASGTLAFAVGFVGAIGVVAWQAVEGRLTIGDVLMAATLCSTVNSQVAQITQFFSWTTEVLRSAGRLRWLMDFGDAVRQQMGEADAPAPPTLRDSIELDRVGFRYPGSETAVLHDVSLRVPAGSVVAIVGENGAGKTTLAKLLLRLYDPSEGRILVDGTDLRGIDPDRWREATAAGFQDFAHFELLALETVGVGDIPRITDEPAVGRALDRAGASDVVAQLPAGLLTQLGKQWDDGAEPSVGQWQKLALGRALMRDAPLLLVLDEPTAALDAPTEHALFERFTSAGRRAGSPGAVTVLVSHRFSTVRMADLIAVLDAGRLVEFGTHAELVAKQGLYAELYAIQARAYS